MQTAYFSTHATEEFNVKVLDTF